MCKGKRNRNYIDGNFQLKSVLTYGPNSDRNRLLDYDCERKLCVWLTSSCIQKQKRQHKRSEIAQTEEERSGITHTHQEERPSWLRHCRVRCAVLILCAPALSGSSMVRTVPENYIINSSEIMNSWFIFISKTYFHLYGHAHTHTSRYRVSYAEMKRGAVVRLCLCVCTQNYYMLIVCKFLCCNNWPMREYYYIRSQCV